MAATQDDVPDAKIGESSDSEVEDLLKPLSDGDMLAAVTAQNQLAQTNTATAGLSVHVQRMYIQFAHT